MSSIKSHCYHLIDWPRLGWARRPQQGRCPPSRLISWQELLLYNTIFYTEVKCWVEHPEMAIIHYETIIILRYICQIPWCTLFCSHGEKFSVVPEIEPIISMFSASQMLIQPALCAGRSRGGSCCLCCPIHQWNMCGCYDKKWTPQALVSTQYQDRSHLVIKEWNDDQYSRSECRPACGPHYLARLMRLTADKAEKFSE